MSAIQGRTGFMRILVYTQVVAKIKSRCFGKFTRQTRQILQKAEWNISRPYKHVFQEDMRGVSTRIAYYTDTFS